MQELNMIVEFDHSLKEVNEIRKIENVKNKSGNYQNKEFRRSYGASPIVKD